MYCETCKQKLIDIDITTNNIWGFNPYCFNSYKSMKDGFRHFYMKINKKINKEEDFYRVYNNEGYTYTQWYVYVISKNYYKFKDLKKQTLWIFQIMESYDFFKKLIFMGRKDDHLHNTLHHFLKYLDNMGPYQKNTFKLLLDNDLNLEDEDSEKISGHDYLMNKLLSEEDLNSAKELTKQYKSDEELVFSYDIFKDESFIRCEQCNNFINIYEDLMKNKNKIIHLKDILNKFIDIINKRQECLDIYKKYDKLDNSTKRHLHVINLYKIIFDL